MEQYAAVARAGEPRWDTAECLHDGYLYVKYRRLLLPLSEDGVTPNMLLGIKKAVGFAAILTTAHGCGRPARGSNVERDIVIGGWNVPRMLARGETGSGKPWGRVSDFHAELLRSL